MPQSASGPIRILLAICRPRGGDDVPFRSVASRLIEGLSEAPPETVQLKVLRPPTFEQLSHDLRAAKVKGEPYHLVHFDGHGAYGEGEGDPRPAICSSKTRSSTRTNSRWTGQRWEICWPRRTSRLSFSVPADPPTPTLRPLR